jgi:hypothetical protein
MRRSTFLLSCCAGPNAPIENWLSLLGQYERQRIEASLSLQLTGRWPTRRD